MPESYCFGSFFQSEHVHGCQTLLKPTRQPFSANFRLIQKILSKKTSLLVTSGILRLFRNTFPADHMYSRNNWEKIS